MSEQDQEAKAQRVLLMRQRLREIRERTRALRQARDEKRVTDGG